MDLATKKMQTSAKKACFQFAECSFSGAKIRHFLVTSKVLGKKYLGREGYTSFPHFLNFLQWKFSGR